MELDSASSASDVTVASFADGKDLGVNFFDIGRVDAILIRCDGVTWTSSGMPSLAWPI